MVERLGALFGLPDRALEVERIVVHINGRQAASVRVGQRTALVMRPGLVISQAMWLAGDSVLGAFRFPARTGGG